MKRKVTPKKRVAPEKKKITTKEKKSRQRKKQYASSIQCLYSRMYIYTRMCVAPTGLRTSFVNKIEAMHERSLANVKVEPRSTSRLSSALFILPLFYLRD